MKLLSSSGINLISVTFVTPSDDAIRYDMYTPDNGSYEPVLVFTIWNKYKLNVILFESPWTGNGNTICGKLKTKKRTATINLT